MVLIISFREHSDHLIRNNQGFSDVRASFAPSIFIQIIKGGFGNEEVESVIDVGSYGFGIFSNVNKKTYLISSLIGVIPVAVALSYIGVLPLSYEIIAIVAATVFILVVWYLYARRKKVVR